ncbi:hypothetical protein MRO49_25650, partial [Escherichia coli]|uniref:hypothetical protein n=1 Tax=Escherichia coli TaxID=562 RepID=UPI002113A64D
GMFSRVLHWAQHLGLDLPAALQLAHSKSAFNADFQELSFASLQDDDQADRSEVIAHRWFSSPRRGPLANFVVGTVDQALVGGL